MNRAHIVRHEGHPTGVTIRLWVDDEKGRHLTVAECVIPLTLLARMVVAVETEQEKSAQYQFAFDD